MRDRRIFWTATPTKLRAQYLGADAARAAATALVRSGIVGVRIVNAGGEQFRWWPELGLGVAP